MNGVYANEWYNGKKATTQEYINNKKSILLGMPRLRQMRIKKGNEAEIVLSGFHTCDPLRPKGKLENKREIAPKLKGTLVKKTKSS